MGVDPVRRAEETAYALNWVDYCIEHNKIFSKTIAGAMQERFKTGTNVNWPKSVSNRLRWLATPKLAAKNLPIQTSSLIQEGSVWVPIEQLQEFLPEMNKSREQLGLPLIGVPGLDGNNDQTSPSLLSLGDDEQSSSQTANEVMATSNMTLPHHDGGYESRQISSNGMGGSLLELELPQARGSATAQLNSTIPQVERLETCLSCHERKVKCDKSRPSCSRCRSEGRKCVPMKQHSASQQSITTTAGRSRVSKQPAFQKTTGGHRHVSHNGQESAERKLEILQVAYDRKIAQFDAHVQFLWRRLDPTQIGSKEVRDRLELIRRILIDLEPDKAFSRLEEDLVKAEVTAALCRQRTYELTKGLPIDDIGQPCFDLVLDIVNNEWTSIHHQVRALTSTPSNGSLPTMETSTVLAVHLKNWFNKVYTLEYSLEWISSNILEVDELEHGGVIRSLVSALLCYRMFATMKAVLKEEYSRIYSKIYAIVHTRGGLSAVQYTDQRAIKMLIEDADFQRDRVQPACNSLALSLLGDMRKIYRSDAWCYDHHNASSAFSQLSKIAVHLVLKLMVSPADYDIIFFEPGTMYDAEWMDGEDKEGTPLPSELCASQRVRLCLFPALAKQQKDPRGIDPNDIDAVLAYNKSFELRWHNGQSSLTGDRLLKAVVVVG